MRRSHTLALTLAALLSVGGTLSSAANAQEVPPQEPAPAPQNAPEPQDPPAVPPGEAPAPVLPAPDGEGAPAAAGEPATVDSEPTAAPDTPTAEEDAAARELLTAAAARQGGATLAAPGGSLDSFRIVFHKVTLWRPDAQGGRSRVDSESPGLIVYWKGGQIRTDWRLVGDKPVVRGVMHRRKPDGTTADYPWLFDGKATTSLLNAAYKKDREEIDRDRKIADALIQVAVLRAMLTDGSTWKVVDDPAFEGTAIRRTPPAGSATPLRLTLWLDPATRDVTGAKLAPNEPGESTMFYGLAYHPEFPKVKDGVLRFPFKFTVREQRVAEQEPFPVMEAMASEASFNDVPDSDFVPPK